MILIRLGLVALVMSVAGQAAEIVLQDGRVLKEASVKSQTPRNVIIRHAGGLASVAKVLLPADLQAQYPVTEVAAVQTEDKTDRVREGAKRAETKRPALPRPMGGDPSVAPAVPDRKPVSENGAVHSVQVAAASVIKSYFEQTRWSPGARRVCVVKIESIRPVEGWPGRWLVIGSAVTDRFREQKREIANPEKLSAPALRRAEYEANHLGREIQGFEAYYSTEQSQPSITISVR